MNDKPNFDLDLAHEQGLHEITKQALADALEEVETLRKLLSEAFEEMRLIRMKDTDAVYNPTLRLRILDELQ